MRRTRIARLGGDTGALLRGGALLSCAARLTAAACLKAAAALLKGGAPVLLRPPQGLIPAGHPPRSLLIRIALGGAFLGAKLGPVFLPVRFSAVSIVSNSTLFGPPGCESFTCFLRITTSEVGKKPVPIGGA